MERQEMIQVAVEGAKQAGAIVGGIFVTGVFAVGAAIMMSKSKSMTDETVKKITKTGKAVAAGIGEKIAEIKERP